MKWAVVGSLGMLGKELVRFLSERGEEVESFHRGNLELTQFSWDLVPRFAGINVIVNCVAYTKVDQAEVEREKAYFANAHVPSILAHVADSVGALLIHISSDYVFDGSSINPYTIDSLKNPRSFYGETKSIGEELVLAFDNSRVVRTSWLYGPGGDCFPQNIARKLLAGDSLKVVDDQMGSPTNTKDLAEFIFRLGRLKTEEAVWHGVSGGSTSWFGFAEEIAITLDFLRPMIKGDNSATNSYTRQISATSTDQYPTTARRPKNSVLEPSVIAGFEIPNWKWAWSRAAEFVLAQLL